MISAVGVVALVSGLQGVVAVVPSVTGKEAPESVFCGQDANDRACEGNAWPCCLDA